MSELNNNANSTNTNNTNNIKEETVMNSKREHIEKTICALIKAIGALVDEVSPGSSFSAYRTDNGIISFNNAYWKVDPDEHLEFSEIDGELYRLDRLFNILQKERKDNDEA